LAPDLVESRQTLCVVLDALAEQREGLVVVGAHAVHERTKHLDMMSTATRDSDLAVVPSLVSDEPDIERLLRSVGLRHAGEFEGHENFVDQPGTWCRGWEGDRMVGQVDLCVPFAVSGSTKKQRRPRSMSAHGRLAARWTEGLEVAVFDHEPMPIESFEDGSVRQANVAGFAGLLCAKAYKIGERIGRRDVGRGDRVVVKDGGDTWRLMAASDPQQVAGTLAGLALHSVAGAAVSGGVRHLRTLHESGELLAMAQADLQGQVSAARVRDVYHTWTGELFSAIDHR